MNTQQTVPSSTNNLSFTITPNINNTGGVVTNTVNTNSGVNNVQHSGNNNNNTGNQPYFTFEKNDYAQNKNLKKKRTKSSQEGNEKPNNLRKSTVSTIKGTKIKGFRKNIIRVVVLYRDAKEMNVEKVVKEFNILYNSFHKITALPDSIGGVIIFFRSKTEADKLLSNNNNKQFKAFVQSGFIKYKYKVNVSLSYSNIWNVIDLVEKKGHKIITFNLVTTTSFWAVGFNEEIIVDENDIYKDFIELDQSLTTIKLKTSTFIKDEDIINKVLELWGIKVNISRRVNEIVFISLGKNNLNSKITTGFYINNDYVFNISYKNKIKYLNQIKKQELNNSIAALIEQNKNLENRVKNLEEKSHVTLENRMSNIEKKTKSLQHLESRIFNIKSLLQNIKQEISQSVNFSINEFFNSQNAITLFSNILN